MKWMPTIILATACIGLQPAAAISDDAGLPLRKAGSWELKTVMDEGRGPREQMLSMCIDADMERKTVAASGQEHRSDCSKYEIKKTGDTTTVDATCAYDERAVTTHTEMSGDFQTAFRVRVESTTSGALRGQPISIKRTIIQEGKYLGAGCGELQAGEAKGVDGRMVVVQ